MPIGPALNTPATFLTVLLLGLFAMAARNVVDPDVWWHLKTGELIAAEKSVPHTDPFSYTRAGAPWVTHEWLSELFLYQVQRVAGMGGLIVLFAAMIPATFLLLYLRCGPHPYVAGAVTLASALVTRPLWGVRPQIISLLFTSLWLLILDRSERQPRVLWWTLPLTVLWVNLHAGFAVGLALSALFLAAQWIKQAFGRPSQGPKWSRAAAFILLVDVLLVALNPNGLRMFFYPIETLRSSAMQNYIAEWASPNFHRPEYWPFLLFALAVFAAAGSSRANLRPRDLLLLLVSFYAGLRAIRLMPLFALIAAPVLAESLKNLLPFRASPLPTPSAARPVLNAMIVLAMAMFGAVHTWSVIRHQPQAETENFPARAVAFLQAHPPPGHIFNHYDWGGYLIWKLYPPTQMFIDGRADLYGKPLLDQFSHTYQLKGDWQQPLRDWDIGTVVVPSDSALAEGLRESSRWAVAYSDPQAIVLAAGSARKTLACTGVTPGTQ